MELESNSSYPLYKPSAGKSVGDNHNNNNHEDLNISKKKSRRKRNICLGVLAVVLLIILIIVILGFTVFKPKKPEINVVSVSLADFDISLDLLRVSVGLNLSLDATLSVRNPNHVGFQYHNTSAVLKYRGEVVGEAPVRAGKISSRQTRLLNVTLTLMGDRFISNSNLYSDVIAGSLPLNTFARIKGKVRILFFKIGVVSSTSCDVVVDISSRSIKEQTCKYKTKI